MPLHFKGDAPKKKKRKHASSSHDKGSSRDAVEDLSGWLPVPSAQLALGPLYITLPFTPITRAPVCVALQPTTNKVYPFVLGGGQASGSAGSGAAPQAPADILKLGLEQDELDAVVVHEADPAAEGPTDVNHVWVCTRVPDTDDKVTLRSGTTGKFLACDEVGVVTADREARGQQEEFAIEDSQGGRPGSVVLRSSYGKLLSVDVVAGGKLELRADAENEDETERWNVYMQGEFVSKAKKAILDRKGVKAAIKTSGGDGLTVVRDVGKAENELM